MPEKRRALEQVQGPETLKYHTYTLHYPSNHNVPFKEYQTKQKTVVKATYPHDCYH